MSCMSKRPLMIAFVLIIAAYLGNGIYYEKKQLDEGFFLEHNYEFNTDPKWLGTISFELNYLDNRNETKEIGWIEIPEIENLRMIHNYLSDPYSYKYYERRTFTFDSSSMSEEQLPSLAGVEINEVTVHYNNGESKRMPIGSIQFVSYESSPDTDSAEQPLDNYSSGGSSNGAGFIGSRANESLTIMNAKVSNLGLSNDAFCFQSEVTGTSSDAHTVATEMFNKVISCQEGSYPISVNKDDTVWINYKFDKNNAGTGALIYSRFHIQLEGLRENGEPFQQISAIYYQPSLNDEDILTIIKQRGNMK